MAKKKTYDELGAMMAWEDGSLDEAGTLKLFQHLVDNGMAWRLQGMYGRFAQSLLDAGLIHYPKKHKHVADSYSGTDYYGNNIPTEAEYKAHKKAQNKT